MRDPDAPCKTCFHPHKRHATWRNVRICIHYKCLCTDHPGFYR